VICIDLDNFKWVNGHARPFAGRYLTARCGARLRRELRERDTVARLGGDEFAILRSHVEKPEEVSDLLARLLAVFGEPFALDGHTVTVGTSIGVALAPGDGSDPDRLLKNADMALYRAKAEGKPRSGFSSRTWTHASRRGGGWKPTCARRCRPGLRGALPAAGRS